MSIEKISARNVSISVNVHGSSVELQTVSQERLLGRYAYGKYLPIGVDRMLRLLQKLGLRSTFFVPGTEARAWPSLMREISGEGHEIAAHGDAMEDHGALGDTEEAVLRRAHDSIADVVGKAPAGWRAPHGLLSRSTLPLLSAMGYRYDSSFQDDDFPYRLDPDGGTGMIEIPQNEMLMDSTYFSIRQTHDRVIKNWTEEITAMHTEGGYSCITLHPRPDYGVGRPSRMDMLEEFLLRVCQLPGGVRFATCGEIAEAALAAAS